MGSDIATLQSAVTSLEAGRYEDALLFLTQSNAATSIVGKSVWHVASALIAERDGDAATAESHFQHAHALGVPLAAVLLACARYFKQSGQYEKSYHNYSILQNFTPGILEEFLRGLPSSELCRYSPLKVKRLLLGARPNLYGLPPYKQALASQLGKEEAGLAFAQMTGQPPGCSVETLPLVSLRTYAKERALTYQELIPGKQMFFPPPDVFGGTERQGFQVTTRDFFCCVVSNAVVSCKSNIVLTDDAALLDFQSDELAKAPLDLSIDPIVLSSDEKTVTVLRANTASKPPLQAALSLNGIHSYAFGHWVLEFLPKVWACLDRPGFGSIPILVDEQMPPQHLQALKFFVGVDHPIQVLGPGESVRVGKLLTCSMIVYMPHGSKPGADIAPDARSVDSRGYASLIEKARPRLEARPAAQGPERIYLLRKDTQHRRLINRLEVEAWLVERKFHLVDFADIPFAKQIELVRGADFVLGPHGSAFLAAFFARPGTRIGIFNHEYLDDFEWYSEAFRALGLRHSILVGDTVKKNANYLTFSDYRIDLHKLDAYFQHLQALP